MVRQETDEAIELLEAAINTSPESSPQTATLLYNLARVHLFRFHRLRDGKSLRQAQDLFFTALTQRWALVHVRILAGREFLSLPGVFDSRDRDRAEAAVETYAKLVPVSISYSLNTQDKQRILSQALGIGSDSAASALHFDKSASYAMTLLETGRAVPSSSLLNLRGGDISSLSESTPELVEQFTKSRAFLDENSAMARALRAVEDIENHRYRVGLRCQYARRIYEDKLTRAIESIRKKPMFEGFMSHATETDMLHAAKDGPIVALNVTSHRCNALVIQADKVSSLELPNLDIQSIQARSSDPQSVETLSWLWDTIVLPVLDYLGYHGPPVGTGNLGSMPHIWWIPTGSVIGFPLHAAGHHLRRNSETPLDRVVSSYSLCVNVLIRTRQQRRDHLAGTLRSQKALIVSAPRPPGQQALHHAEDEAKVVCQVYHSHDFPRYHGVHDIVKRLKSCCILHFIGHGKTDKQNPFGSALILDNGDELVINELVETALNSNPPFLAYLSACGTGRVGNETATDELHLAAAFQVAGFRHIIATLWDVDDQLCVYMAKNVYTSLETTELDDVSVRTALHGAVVALRDEWVQQEEEAGRGGTRGDRNLECARGHRERRHCGFHMYTLVLEAVHERRS
ncbi:uncharacterized protein QC763_0087800 [Podospora pseudopauciseta]|uniref:CHAT domain-containing protein n=1 Tax=Podospora pseudopauciseta TaxID=2093780 RepID=A0ABR0H9Q6_9PEZI|nr:hypothetical protein QC763_0087800 [Podospora pseudopauciseta]